jgi:hypothetical protein
LNHQAKGETMLSRLSTLFVLAALTTITFLATPASASNGASGILANDLPGPAPITVLVLGWMMILKRRRNNNT